MKHVIFPATLEANGICYFHVHAVCIVYIYYIHSTSTYTVLHTNIQNKTDIFTT